MIFPIVNMADPTGKPKVLKKAKTAKVAKRAPVQIIDPSNRVVAYIRVSTTLQDASGLSQHEQEEEIKKFCELKGLVIHHKCSEVISGAIVARKRPGLNQALEMIEQGLASGIVVTKLDRLGRGAADTIALIDYLNEKKYKFFSIKEGIDCTTSMGKAMIGLMCVFANLERDMIKERVQVVMDGKKKRGELCGRCPFGMKAVPNETGVKILVPDEEEQETIRIAQQLRDMILTRKLRSGKEKKYPMTYREIGEELVRQGRKNRGGEAKWYPSQVMALVKMSSEESEEEEEEEEEEISEG